MLDSNDNKLTLFRLALQRNAVCRLLLPAVNAVKIPLRGGEVLVADKFLHGSGVRSCLQLQGTKGVPARMVGDMFGDACRLYPLLSTVCIMQSLKPGNTGPFLELLSINASASSPIGLWIICLVFCIRVVI